jgi:hypothetical protein
MGNLFAVGWGIANVLCGVCYVRIGVALTGAILAGLGVSLGAIMPMVFKGSGLFKSAPDLGTPAGLTVCVGVALMLAGVIAASVAGFGRDRQQKKLQQTSGSFLAGLLMTIIAGVLSACIAFAFVYSQGPIVSNLSVVSPGREITVTVDGHDAPAAEKGLRQSLSGKYTVAGDGTIALGSLGPVAVGGMSAAQAAERIAGHLQSRFGLDRSVQVETGSIPATFGVFAVGLLGGALVNIAYAVYLLTKNKSWAVLVQSGR